MGLKTISIQGIEPGTFIKGTNVPWILYAQDLVYFPIESERLMATAMNEVQESGGNAIRWWLHTNGRHSPTFKNGKVSGLHQDTIGIIKRVLDMAQERNLLVSMCLWSFDMLQDKQGQDVQAMKNLLEKPNYTQCYINNALIPILTAVGNHPSILTWEIFNEAEGMVDEFGWSETRTKMKYIQQTINLLSGAIHRHAPGIPVSNGAWSIHVASDIGDFHNYYRDDRLFEAGKDSDGHLDFYQVHFYPQYFNNQYSPFHNPVKHWNLTKPLLIGEFPNNGCMAGKSIPLKDTSESFLYALEAGYAGCMTWRWPYENGMGSFIEDVRPAMISLRNTL